jgi:hypothetical protein
MEVETADADSHAGCRVALGVASVLVVMMAGRPSRRSALVTVHLPTRATARTVREQQKDSVEQQKDQSEQGMTACDPPE